MMMTINKAEIEEIVIRAITESTGINNKDIFFDIPISTYLKDSIEFVKVLIAIEEILSFEFNPEELKLDNINTVSDLVSLTYKKASGNDEAVE